MMIRWRWARSLMKWWKWRSKKPKRPDMERQTSAQMDALLKRKTFRDSIHSKVWQAGTRIFQEVATPRGERAHCKSCTSISNIKARTPARITVRESWLDKTSTKSAWMISRSASAPPEMLAKIGFSLLNMPTSTTTQAATTTRARVGAIARTSNLR